jgi:hypothetical protein
MRLSTANQCTPLHFQVLHLNRNPKILLEMLERRQKIVEREVCSTKVSTGLCFLPFVLRFLCSMQILFVPLNCLGVLALAAVCDS